MPASISPSCVRTIAPPRCDSPVRLEVLEPDALRLRLLLSDGVRDGAQVLRVHEHRDRPPVADAPQRPPDDVDDSLRAGLQCAREDLAGECKCELDGVSLHSVRDLAAQRVQPACCVVQGRDRRPHLVLSFAQPLRAAVCQTVGTSLLPDLPGLLGCLREESLCSVAGRRIGRLELLELVADGRLRQRPTSPRPRRRRRCRSRSSLLPRVSARRRRRGPVRRRRPSCAEAAGSPSPP